MDTMRQIETRFGYCGSLQLGSANSPPGAITVDEFCRLIGVGRTTANKLFQSGAVPSKKVGRRRIIPVCGVVAWLNNQAESV